VVFVSVLIFEIADELDDLLLGPLLEGIALLLLDGFVEKQLVVQIEVAFGHDLEERLAVEVDVLVLLVGLVVDVGVCETK
jgi:hypothetical protein